MHPVPSDLGINLYSVLYHLIGMPSCLPHGDREVLPIRPASPIILCKSTSSHMIACIPILPWRSALDQGSNLDSPIYNRVPVDRAPEDFSLHPRIAPITLIEHHYTPQKTHSAHQPPNQTFHSRNIVVAISGFQRRIPSF